MAPSGAQHSSYHNGQVEIRRVGTRVTVSIELADDYQAMALYENAVRNARAGCLSVKVILPEKQPSGATSKR